MEKELRALTGLRFITAFYVFVFHIHIRWPLTEVVFLKKILDQGAIGMSLFFILSGFVLAYRYADGKVPKRKYFINRLARIYPIYFIAAFLTLPWLGVPMQFESIVDLCKAIAQVFFLVVANFFLIQAWFPQFFDYWNNGGSWSISVEAFFYVLLPFLLPFLVQLAIRRVILLALACYILAIFIGLIDLIFPTPIRAVYYSMPIYRLPEFLIGVCCFLFYSKKGIFLNNWQQIVFVLIFVIYLGACGAIVTNYLGHNWLVIPFFAYMVLSLANGKGIIAYFLSTQLIVWLGKISYSFYSFQALVILALISYHEKLVKAVPILIDNRMVLVLAFSCLMVISTLAYYFIEEPVRKKIRLITKC